QPSLTAKCPSSPPMDGDRLQGGHIDIARPVMVGSRRVGTLYVKANLSDAATRLSIQALATIVALLLGLAVSVAVALRFRGVIALPLMRVSTAAAAVADGRDYSLRAEPAGSDELGHVTEAFNEMLQQMQLHEAELRAANRLKDEFLATLSHEL